MFWPTEALWYGRKDAIWQAAQAKKKKNKKKKKKKGRKRPQCST